MHAGTGTWNFYRAVFRVAAVYDVVLGIVFFFFYAPIFDALGIQRPENTSYIHITSAYVFMQGLGYWFVARDMLRNIDLVRLGVIYKVIYVGLAVYYLATGELLHEVFTWFAVADLVFLALFTAFLVKALPAKGGSYARG